MEAVLVGEWGDGASFALGGLAVNFGIWSPWGGELLLLLLLMVGHHPPQELCARPWLVLPTALLALLLSLECCSLPYQASPRVVPG